MKEAFNEAFELVVGHEGGYTTDRSDRGNWTSGKVGAGSLNGTKFGISAMAYPKLNIKGLTIEDASAIYKQDYWDKARCDDLPFPLDYLTFDAAVNHGVSRAGRFLQASVGAHVDGVIGDRTIEKAQSPTLDLLKAVSEFCTIRALFYTEIGTFQRYKRGWFRRLFDVHATAVTAFDYAVSNGVVEADTDYGRDFLETAPKAAVDVEQETSERAFWEDFQRRAQEAAQRAQILAAA